MKRFSELSSNLMETFGLSISVYDVTPGETLNTQREIMMKQAYDNC